MHLTADDLLRSLREEGMRVTRPRRAVCEVLARSHGDHLTAAEILSRAEETLGGDIDQSTIYRTLDALERVGYLHHVHLGHGPGVVHLSEESDHHHLVCESCGRTTDIPLEELEEALREVARRYRFRPDGVHFALVGKCLVCVDGTKHSVNSQPRRLFGGRSPIH
ncbi:MAG: Fur family transcriptional regulator [Acidimicrobiia bacterium]